MGRMSAVRTSGIAAILGAGPVAILCAGPVQALEPDYGLSYSGVYSDNVARVPNNEQREWINIARGLFVLQEATDEMTARAYSQLEYRHYARGAFDDEVLFGLDGAATWVISPRRLTFTVEDRFTQAPVIPGLATSPSNRQDTNALSLGPNATLHLDRVNNFEVGGRYSNIYYQTAPTDSNRLGAYARLLHQATPITALSANYEPSWVNYGNDTLNPDYMRQDVFVSGHTRRPGTDLRLDAGQIYIDRDNGALRDVDGRLLRATFGRRLNSEATLNLTAADEYSDAGRDEIISNPLVQIVPSPSAVNTTDFVGGGLFAVQRVDAAYIRQRYYGVSRINLFWRRVDFESPQLLLDQHVQGVFADVGFDYSSALTAGLFGNYSETSYDNVYREDQDYGVGGRLVYRFQRTLSFVLEGRWSGRESTLASAEYGERRAVFSVAYDTNYAVTVANPFLQQNDPLYR